MALTDASGRPRSGLMAHPVIGIVVDNVDPEGKGRLKVKFPTLHMEAESAWIRQVTPMAGKERGLYILPEIEDEVLVVFQNGDVNQAVILGSLWNGVDLPPTEAKDGLPGSAKTDTGATWSTDTFTDGTTTIDANDRRFWKSRSGHLFVFDDTEGKETIQIWDKGHTLALVFDTKENRILLTNTKGDIHIRTKETLFLEAGKDIKWRAKENIIGESGKETTHKAGTNWKVQSGQETSLKSGTDFKIDAGTNLTCKAKMNAAIEGQIEFAAKGAMAKVTGSAMVEITAAMVKLN